MDQCLTTSIITPASWSTDIGFINHLVLFNNIYIGVIAEKNGGKSVFCSILKKNLTDRIDTIAYTAKQDQNSRLDLLVTLSRYLNKPLTPEDNLSSLLALINEKQRHVLLIIDDAHFVDEDTLCQLLACLHKLGKKAYFHVLGCSDYKALHLLNRLAKDQYENMIHTIEMGCLNTAELATYIQILDDTNIIKKQLTGKSSLEAFYNKTKGKISQINNEVRQLMMQKHNARNRLSTGALGALAASIILCLSVLFYQNNNFIYLPALHEMENTDSKKSALLKNRASVTETNALVSTLQAAPALASSIPALHWNANIEVWTLNNHSHNISSFLPSIPTEPWTKSRSRLLAKKSVNKEPKNTKPKYTVQIAASRNLAYLKRKMQQQRQLGDDLHIYKVFSNNTSWYVLTYGWYAEWNPAHDALKNLPAHLRSQKAWIRPVGSLDATKAFG